MIKIVTDSTSDLPMETTRDLDITVAPLSIHFGDTTFIDGVDIDASTFYHKLQTDPAHPRTAQPPVGRFEEIYRSLLDAGHEVIAITISSALSGTFNSASLAAQAMPDAKVTVIDSRIVSMALGAMAMHAARMGRDGCMVAEIVAAMDAMMPRLTVIILVDTLTYLQRGGRIGRASSLLGTMLNIKPILTLSDGIVAPLKRVRTRSKALQEMAELVAAHAPLEEMYVMHAAAAGEAAEFATMVKSAIGGRDVPVLPLGPVVGVHIGPGSLGVVMLRQG